MGFCNQFSALARKNWLIWKRGTCGSCCEVFLPILFALMFLGMRQDGQIMTFPESNPIA